MSESDQTTRRAAWELDLQAARRERIGGIPMRMDHYLPPTPACATADEHEGKIADAEFHSYNKGFLHAVAVSAAVTFITCCVVWAVMS